jgi:hypothetical protein
MARLAVQVKGQTMSKANYGVLNSSKKMNKTQYPEKEEALLLFVFWKN